MDNSGPAETARVKAEIELRNQLARAVRWHYENLESVAERPEIQ